MSFAESILLTSVILLTAASLLFAIAFSILARRMPQGYVRTWKYCWLALACFHAVVAAAFVLASRTHPPPAFVRWPVNVLAHAAGFLHVAFLLSGVGEYAAGRRLRHRSWIGLALAAGVVTSLVFPWQPSASLDGAFVRAGVRGLLHGGVLLIGLLVQWRTLATLLTPSRGVLAAALLAYGLHGFYAAIATIRATPPAVPAPYQLMIGAFEMVLLIGVAVGMGLVMLEEMMAAVTQASARIEHMAYHDPLTGLANRPLFADRLRHALAQSGRRPERVGVVSLDLDRFKVVNDGLGHELGDQLLRAVARRLTETLREGDTIARISGDVFAVLLHVGRAQDAFIVADKALRALRAPFDLDGREVFVTASAGLAVCDEHVDSAETLLRQADEALHRAKSEGRDVVCVFDRTMQSSGAERIALESSLRRALTRNELSVHYQPMVRIDTGAVVGMEALIRWNHPIRGLLRPAEFLSIAESTGLIVDIGTWLLDAACAQLGDWHRRGYPGLRMSVNVSAHELAHRHLLYHVAAALAKAQTPASSLCIEVTEQVALEQPEEVIRELQALRALGVRIALDDFGTGFSSLVHLRRLPVDELKIDASFVQGVVREPSAAAIVTAVTGLARDLRLSVVAEGVETDDQLAAVVERGCGIVQGFLFAAPGDAEEIERSVLVPGRDAPLRRLPRSTLS
jgi:diguanylate cyclase (GGDEF)-like protein